MPGSGIARHVIAVDPGTHKCGLAVLDSTGAVVWQAIISRDQVFARVSELLAKYTGAQVAIGGSTQGSVLSDEFMREGDISARMVDETDSTMLARELFWRENRPGCLWAIFPPSFRPLPRPIDDYAAIIIGRRFLAD